MRDDEASQVAADMHRLANRIQDLAKHSNTLSDENVNTQTATSLRQEQEVVQDDLKQLISDLIQLYTESDRIETERGEHRLAKNSHVPIPDNSETDLPPPRVGKPGRGEQGPPPWAGGTEGNPGKGNGQESN